MSLEIFPTYPKIRPDQIDMTGLGSEAITGLNQLFTATPGKISVNDLKDWILTFIPHADPTTIRNRGTVKFSDDWDSITEPGVYSVIGDTPSPSAPPASYLWGQLIVLKSANAYSAVTQIYISHWSTDDPFSQYNFWVRHNYSVEAGFPWTPWHNLNPPPQIQVGGVAWGDLSTLQGGFRKAISAHVFKAPRDLVVQVKEIAIRSSDFIAPYAAVKVRGIQPGLGYTDVLLVGGHDTDMYATGLRSYTVEANTGTISGGSIVILEVGVDIFDSTLVEDDAVTATFLIAKTA